MTLFTWLSGESAAVLTVTMALQVTLVLAVSSAIACLIRRNAAARHAVCLAGLVLAVMCPVLAVKAGAVAWTWLRVDWPAEETEQAESEIAPLVMDVPAPEAPSFMAMRRDTAEVLWTDNSPGENILHGQWASPSYAVLGGRPQVLFPGGDGWLYSFDPDGNGNSRLLWKFDCNPKETVYSVRGRSPRATLVAYAAIYDGLVYIGTGEDPEHGEGDGHLWCIDPTRRTDCSDVSAQLAVDAEGRVIPPRRIQCVDTAAGERAIPNPDSAVVWHSTGQDQNQNGEAHWTDDLFDMCWASPLIVDDKVYVGDEEGRVCVFRHSPDPEVAMPGGEPLAVNDLGTAVYLTPVVANDVLYIATRNGLYAIERDDE